MYRCTNGGGGGCLKGRRLVLVGVDMYRCTNGVGGSEA